MNNDRKRPFTWRSREHVPIERIRERISGGFVLVGGWQVKYDPTPEHRRELFAARAAG